MSYRRPSPVPVPALESALSDSASTVTIPTQSVLDLLGDSSFEKSLAKSLDSNSDGNISTAELMEAVKKIAETNRDLEEKTRATRFLR